MKLIKRLGLHVAAFVLAASLTNCFVPDTHAIGTTKEEWCEAVDPYNYDTWRQDYMTGYDDGSHQLQSKDWVLNNIKNPVVDLNSVAAYNFFGDFGMGGNDSNGKPSYTVRNWGSLFFALSKMMVASGAVDEYSSENPKGINPGILYYASVYSKDNNGDTFLDVSTWTDGVYTAAIPKNIKGWHDEAGDIMPVIEYYWGNNIEFDLSESIKKLSDEAKQEIITNYMDEGKYVILTLSHYKYFDVTTNTIVNGNENAHHSLFLTGYSETSDGQFSDFTMDDSVSPCTNFSDLYTYSDIKAITVFTPTPAIETKLDFYKGKYVSEPWYLKLISEKKPVTELDTKLLPIETATKKEVKFTFGFAQSGTNAIDPNELVKMDERIMPDARKLMKDLDKANGDEVAFIDVGYRTFDEQKKVYDQMSVTYGDKVSQYCDKAGESEHNVGIALDFKVEGQEDFSKTESYKWLCQHAHEYGFILRFPNSPKAIETTGKEFNASHWRYIGTEHATGFIKFIEASYKEDSTGIVSNVEAYTNIGYNGKVYEDYYLEVVLPTYTNANMEEITDVDDIGKEEETKPKYSDATLRRVYYIIRHPVKAVGNLFAGLCQMAHNAIAVGKTGNILNISWLLNWNLVKQISSTYLIIAAVVVCIALVLRYLRYMISANDNILMILRDSGTYIAVSLVPILLIVFVGNCFDGLTGIITKDMSGKIAMIESTYKEEEEDDIVTSWDLLTDADLSKNLFRETFINSENGSSYEFATIKMPTGYDDNGIVYKEMTLRELYDTVSVDTIVEGMTSQRLSNESGSVTSSGSFFNTTQGVTKTMLDTAVIDTAAPKYLYYSCNRFVPVNYDKYGDSVFYYFYDWVKYQYLSYWAYSGNQDGKVLSSFAQGFVLPGESFKSEVFSGEPDAFDDSSFSKYVERIEMLENLYLGNAHSGVYLMYDDMNYVRNNDIYYNDLFGLSYLFKMTSGDNTSNYAMVDNYYTNTSDIEVWAGVNKVNYINTMPDYDVFRKQVISGDFSYTNVQPLTSIITGPAWNVYKESSYLVDKRNKGMSYWTFSPSYLSEKFGQSLTNPVSTSTKGRIPWRIYASTARLKEAYPDKSVEWTNLEQQLCALNEKIYKDVVKLSSYMPGQITDDTMIFVVALAATARFNELFDSYSQPVYPKGIDIDNLDMDKIIRLTYADTLVSNESLDTMYMIYDSPGGLAVVLIVLLSELLMLIASAARAIILIMFFIGVVVLTLNYLRGKMPQKSSLLSGVIWQFLSLLGMHALLVGTNQLIFNVLVGQDSATMRILFSVIGLVLYFIITVVNIAMLMAFVKDIKNFGGVILKGAVNTVKSQIDIAGVDSSKEQSQIDIENAELKLQKEQERRLINQDKLEDKITRNIDKLEEGSEDNKHAYNRHRRITRARGTISKTKQNTEEQQDNLYNDNKD